MTDDRRPNPETDERAANPEHPRTLLDRTKDEVQAWFGDAAAAGRRQRDEAVGDHSGKGPTVDLEPDERIVADISQRLTDDHDLDASHVEVKSHDGQVTLSGDVKTGGQRAHAGEVAEGVAGVHHVDNRLQVV